MNGSMPSGGLGDMARGLARQRFEEIRNRFHWPERRDDVYAVEVSWTTMLVVLVVLFLVFRLLGATKSIR